MKYIIQLFADDEWHTIKEYADRNPYIFEPMSEAERIIDLFWDKMEDDETFRILTLDDLQKFEDNNLDKDLYESAFFSAIKLQDSKRAWLFATKQLKEQNNPEADNYAKEAFELAKMLVEKLETKNIKCIGAKEVLCRERLRAEDPNKAIELAEKYLSETFSENEKIDYELKRPFRKVIRAANKQLGISVDVPFVPMPTLI